MLYTDSVSPDQPAQPCCLIWEVHCLIFCEGKVLLQVEVVVEAEKEVKEEKVAEEIVIIEVDVKVGRVVISSLRSSIRGRNSSRGRRSDKEIYCSRGWKRSNRRNRSRERNINFKEIVVEEGVEVRGKSSSTDML